MPRQRKMGDDEARSLILTTARNAFAADGFHHATMDDIAEVSGLSKPYIYRYFSGKEELYLAVVDYCIDAFLPDLLQAIRSEDDAAHRTRQAIHSLTRLVADKPADYAILFESDMLGSETIAERVSGLREKVVDVLTEVVLEDSKFTTVAESRLCADAITSATLTSVKTIAGAGSADEREQLTEVLFRFIWGGIYLMDEKDSVPTGEPDAPAQAASA